MEPYTWEKMISQFQNLKSTSVSWLRLLSAGKNDAGAPNDGMFSKFGEQGMAQWWERSPPINVARVQIQCRRHMSVEFAVDSLLCSERFFAEYSGFPLSSKTNICKFQFDQVSGRRRITLWMCYIQIVIYLYLFIFI